MQSSFISLYQHSPKRNEKQPPHLPQKHVISISKRNEKQFTLSYLSLLVFAEMQQKLVCSYLSFISVCRSATKHSLSLSVSISIRRNATKRKLSLTSLSLSALAEVQRKVVYPYPYTSLSAFVEVQRNTIYLYPISISAFAEMQRKTALTYLENT